MGVPNSYGPGPKKLRYAAYGQFVLVYVDCSFKYTDLLWIGCDNAG